MEKPDQPTPIVRDIHARKIGETAETIVLSIEYQEWQLTIPIQEVPPQSLEVSLSVVQSLALKNRLQEILDSF